MQFSREVVNTAISDQPVWVRHTDLEQVNVDNRDLEVEIGKSTPIRILKRPLTDLFFKDTLPSGSNIDLFKLRFNKKSDRLTVRPARHTTYLTFKQRRYNLKKKIKPRTFKEYANREEYSGNPFLKNRSIVEESFNRGGATSQYRLVKKAKARLNTTKVAG